MFMFPDPVMQLALQYVEEEIRLPARHSPLGEAKMRKSERDQVKRKKKPATSAKERLPWSGAEVGILKRLYRTHSNAQIAKLLGRKVSSIVFKAHRLRLTKGVRRLSEMGQENISKRWQARRRKK